MEPSSPAADSCDGQALRPPADMASLIVANHAAVYRYACRLCGCPTEAEDLSQQTFLIAQQKLHQLRDAERACAWLLSIVRSCFLKSIRRTRPARALDVELNLNDVPDTPPPDEIDRELLTAALNELPEEYRLVLLMFYFEELSYQSIAQELAIPLGTVMSRLSRAKGHLRERLGARRATANVALARRPTSLPDSSGPAPARTIG